MVEELEVPIVIVGGGPIGLTLSCILGKNQIEHVLLERNEGTTKWPKAILINTRSMELYHRLGLDTVLREKALPEGGETIMTRSLLKEEPIVRIQISGNMSGLNPQKELDGTIKFDEQWTVEDICKLSQLYMEPLLKKEAAKYSTSEIKFGWPVVSISQTQENVVVEAVSAETGERKRYRARYAVGCDGGRSFVRKSLGIHFTGEFNLTHLKSVSFVSEELRKRLPVDFFAATVVKPDVVAFFFPVNIEGQFVAHALIQEKGADPDGLVRTLLDNEDIPYTTVFDNEWDGHFASAETLQDGRIFLAGDSSHIMIPVGGFGMNTGILDAYDIGWKLVATLQGWGGDQLLASYTAERLPAIRTLLRRISQIFHDLRRYSGIAGFLLTTPPFKYIMRLFVDPSKVDIGLSGILFGIRLKSSPLCIPSRNPLPPEHPQHYSMLSYPGCRAPHFQFEDGATLYDKLGSAFTLLHLQPSSQNYDPILAAAAHYAIPLKDFVLIRPDLYIAWCGNEIPTLLHNEDVNEGARVLMKVVTGAASLPAEWQQSRPNKRTISAAWLLPVAIAVIVGITAFAMPFLRQYKWIN